MPIYEYRCSTCGTSSRRCRSFGRAARRPARPASSDALVKQVSAAGFQLKGSGWYVTDFRSGSKPAAKTRREGDAKADAKTGREAPTRSRRREADGRRPTRRKPKSRRPSPSLDAAPAAPQAAPRRPDAASTLPRMKRYLIAGLLVWVPLGITIWVLHFLVTTLDQTLLLLPEAAQPDAPARLAHSRVSAWC